MGDIPELEVRVSDIVVHFSGLKSSFGQSEITSQRRLVVSLLIESVPLLVELHLGKHDKGGENERQHQDSRS